jgi:hypothetical protein
LLESGDAAVGVPGGGVFEVGGGVEVGLEEGLAAFGVEGALELDVGRQGGVVVDFLADSARAIDLEREALNNRRGTIYFDADGD